MVMSVGCVSKSTLNQSSFIAFLLYKDAKQQIFCCSLSSCVHEVNTWFSPRIQMSIFLLPIVKNQMLRERNVPNTP